MEQLRKGAKQSLPSMGNGRRWLTVTFAQKDMAKSHGARWDPEKRLWHAPDGADMEALTGWLAPEEVVFAVDAKQLRSGSDGGAISLSAGHENGHLTAELFPSAAPAINDRSAMLSFSFEPASLNIVLQVVGHEYLPDDPPCRFRSCPEGLAGCGYPDVECPHAAFNWESDSAIWFVGEAAAELVTEFREEVLLPHRASLPPSVRIAALLPWRLPNGDVFPVPEKAAAV